MEIKQIFRMEKSNFVKFPHHYLEKLFQIDIIFVKHDSHMIGKIGAFEPKNKLH